MKNEFYNNDIFSKNLKHEMLNHNMTNSNLAKALGCSKTIVSEWLSGKKLPRMEKIDKMCVLFNCSRSQLIDNAELNPMSVSDEIKLAFFGNIEGVTDEMIAEVKHYAEYIMDREKKQTGLKE